METLSHITSRVILSQNKYLASKLVNVSMNQNDNLIEIISADPDVSEKNFNTCLFRIENIYPQDFKGWRVGLGGKGLAPIMQFLNFHVFF